MRNDVNGVVNSVVNRPLTSEEKVIIELIKNSPYLSADKLSKILNKSSRSIQRSLAKLRDDGFIKSEPSEKDLEIKTIYKIK